MNHRKFVLLSLLTACSTAPSAAPVVQTVAKSKTVPVMAVSLERVNSSDCTQTANLDTRNWKSLLAKGNACVKAQAWEKLEQIGNGLITKEPFQPWGSYFLSLAAEGQGNMARSMWMIDLSLKKNSDYGILYFQKGRLLWNQKIYSGALEQFIKSVALDENLTDAHLFLGQIFFRDQEYAKASEQFFMVLKSRPGDAMALSGLGESRLQKGDNVGALEIFQRAIHAHPEKVEFRLRQAFIYESILNEKETALGLYIDIKQYMKRNNIKTVAALDVDRKITELESVRRAPSSLGVKERGGKK